MAVVPGGRVWLEAFGCAFAVQVTFTGGHHAGHDGFGGGTLDGSAAAVGGGGEEGGGEGEGAAEPVGDDGFELSASRGAEPVEGRGVEGRGVHLAEDGRVGHAGGEEGHEFGGLPVREAGDDLGGDVRLDVAPWLGVRGCCGGELGGEVARLDLREYWIGGDVVVVGDDYRIAVSVMTDRGRPGRCRRGCFLTFFDS